MLRRISRLVLVSLTLAGTFGAIQASEGRIPLFESVVLDGSAGNISGHYIVTRDIKTTGEVVTIDIIGTGTETIDIDLNGFTLTGAPLATAVIRVRGGGVLSFTLRNGSIEAFNPSLSAAVVRIRGVEGDAADNLVIEDVKLIEGGFAIESTFVTNFAIRRNIIVESQVGISITNNQVESEPLLTGIIEDNILRDLAFDAITVVDANRSLTIRDNQIVGQEGTGITIEDTLSSVVVGNNIEGGTVGILLINGSDCQVRENVITSSTGNGISFLSTNDCFVLENSVSNNRGSGLHFFESFGNFVEHNLANINSGFGIYFNFVSSDNIYGRNVLRNNLGDLDCYLQNAVAPCATPSICDEGDNNTSYSDNMGPGPGC